MTTIHAVLCEDYGRIDPASIRTELLAETGIRSVTCESTPNRLRIEYDPALMSKTRLVDLLCRHALFPEPSAPPDKNP